MASKKENSKQYPVIIIGAGSVGVRLVRELLFNNPSTHIKIFGGEERAPYSREYLSRFLAGKIDRDKLHSFARLPESDNIEAFYNNPVIQIDKDNSFVVDSNGQKHQYSSLVLAVGSRPKIPDVPGINLQNVIMLRSLGDVDTLLARQVASRNTVVLGGGLIGLDAANAMSRYSTNVIVVEQSHCLIHPRLDEHASVYLRLYLDDLGIDVRVSNTLASIDGDKGKVEQVTLDDGEIIECDTVIISIGTTPNTDLAKSAGLKTAEGILVNDFLQTSDPSIYSVGECIQHRDRVFGGRVKPGYDQSKVLAAILTGTKTRYKGSTPTTRFKVIDYPVLSIGESADEIENAQEIFHRNIKKMKYRKLVLKHGCLRGVVAAGKWKGVSKKLEKAVEKKQFIWPWQRSHFEETGKLWD